MKTFPFLISLALVCLISEKSVATHLIGAEIRYTHIGGFTYSIEGVMYTELCAPADRPEILMSVGGGIDTIPRTSIVDLMDLGCCGTRISGYQFEHTFAGNGSYTIELFDMNRSGGIVNIPASIQTPLCVTTTLHLNPFSGHNNSIQFSTPATELVQNWNVISHDPGAFDQDGDSLSFELIVPMSEGCSPVAGYTFPEAANYIWLDPENGMWIWDHPLAQGLYTFALRGTEWRDGTMVGEVVREMTVCLEAFEVAVTDQPMLSEFIVSPTLTHGPINITDRSNKGLSVDVLDAYGKIVLRTRTDQGENRIHLDHLASGTYIIRCRRSDGEFNAVRVLKH